MAKEKRRWRLYCYFTPCSYCGVRDLHLLNIRGRYPFIQCSSCGTRQEV